MELSAQERAFAAEVSRCLAESGLTQEGVARRVGLSSRSKISEACSGAYLPSYPVLEKMIIALGMDCDRAAALWRAAHQGRRERQRVERVAGLPASNDWAELPVLPAEVAALLRAQIQLAHDLPYKLPLAREITLDTVYVRQELGSAAEEPRQEQQPRHAPVLDDRGMLLPAPPAPRAVVRPPSRPVRAALDGHDHLLVTGGPGQGKSTLSLRLTADIAAAWTSPVDQQLAPLDEPVVPLRLTARELAARPGLPFPKALAACVGAEYGQMLGREVTPELLAIRVGGCRWLLLIDALDEVASSAERERLVNTLSVWASPATESPYRIVLTTRPIEGTTLAPFQRAAVPRYELQPFDEHALRRFAEQWFGDDGQDDAQRFLRQIRDAHLDELVYVPLLATIAAIVFTEHSDRPLPDNQYELYESYLELIHTAHGNAPGSFEHLRTDLLEHLGRIRVVADTSLVAAARDRIRQLISPGQLFAGWQDELTAYLVAVGPLIYRNGDLRFLHHTFAEHLAATADARLLPDTFRPEHAEFNRLLHAALQSEPGRHARTVLVHYTRLHEPEADHLIAWLHAGMADQHLLAARLLAQHVPASAATINDFLTTARAWAVTTHYMGQEILRCVSRAAHHPGLATWLANLVADEKIPWPSRITAATALAARVHGAHATAASCLLSAVVLDDSIEIAERLTAAEGLAECGTSERDLARQSLQTLLADPGVPARRYRRAAVTLASIGGEEEAVAALLAILDTPETTTLRLVEAATGLTEIGAKFHDRCADIFLRVLQDPSCDAPSRQAAAAGLGALGPQRTEQAGAALSAIINDRRINHSDRLAPAEALVGLGPQYRQIAGEFLLAILADHGVKTNVRRRGASILAKLGEEYRATAVAHLRAAIADRKAGANAIVWAIESLAELGPELHDEAAREFRVLVDDPLVEGFEHAYALGNLVKLGSVHREQAIVRLRTDMCNAGMHPETRYRVAQELANLGPDFHEEVTQVLCEIIAARPDVEVLVQAWHSLATLKGEFRDPAADALLAILRSSHTDSRTLMLIGYYVSDLDPVRRTVVAEILQVILADTERSYDARAVAAMRLCEIGTEFQQTAVDGLVRLLQGPEGMRFGSAWIELSSFAPVMRARLVVEIRRLALDPGSSSRRRLQDASELVKFDSTNAVDVAPMLRSMLADPVIEIYDRVEAARTLAKIEGISLSEIMFELHSLETKTRTAEDWATVVKNLAELDNGGAVLVSTMLLNRNASRAFREAAATMLIELLPDASEEAQAELRQQADDELLDFDHRTDVAMKVADFGAELGATISYHQNILNDDSEPVDHRCRSAEQLVRLDRAYWPTATATVRRLLDDLHISSIDQQKVIAKLKDLNALRPGELNRLALAITHHPAAGHIARYRAIALLPKHLAREPQRALLHDHNVPVGWRVVWAAGGREMPLRAEIEVALRDVIEAPETNLIQRIRAVDSLDWLRPELAAEVDQRLRDLVAGSETVSFNAWRQLSKVNDRWRRETIEKAAMLVADLDARVRDRLRAAELLLDLVSAPTSDVVDLLRSVAADTRVAGLQRMRAMTMLCQFEGPERVRLTRDDDQESPIVRSMAAESLVGYTAEDRAIGATVLETVAADPRTHPALRVRVAKNLAVFGRVGRVAAAHILGSIVADASVTTTIRVAAGKTLVKTMPNRVHDVLTVLRDLSNTGRPLCRLRALAARVSMQDIDAISEMIQMATDRHLGPVTRLRCAASLADLRRDQREVCTITARDLMHDDTVPIHVRQHAARDLARWSGALRTEAREALRSLTARANR